MVSRLRLLDGRGIVEDRELAAGSGFIEFQGEIIRVGEEGEAFAREFVYADRFAVYAPGLKISDALVQVAHAKGQVAEAAGFGPRGAAGSLGKGKQFDHIVLVKGQVQFIRLPFGPIGFPDDLQTQHGGIELF